MEAYAVFLLASFLWRASAPALQQESEEIPTQEFPLSLKDCRACRQEV